MRRGSRRSIAVSPVQTSFSPCRSSKVASRTAGTLTLFAFDEGQSLSEHTAPFDALAYVLEGKAEIAIDGQAAQVSAGEGILMPANRPHAVQAISQFKMLLIMIRS